MAQSEEREEEKQDEEKASVEDDEDIGCFIILSSNLFWYWCSHPLFAFTAPPPIDFEVLTSLTITRDTLKLSSPQYYNGSLNCVTLTQIMQRIIRKLQLIFPVLEIVEVPKEISVVIIKPDALKHGHADSIIQNVRQLSDTQLPVAMESLLLYSSVWNSSLTDFTSIF